MLDQQLISRLFTRPYNPEKSTSDILTDVLRKFIRDGVSIQECHYSIFNVLPTTSEDTFYLCYQAAILSI